MTAEVAQSVPGACFHRCSARIPTITSIVVQASVPKQNCIRRLEPFAFAFSEGGGEICWLVSLHYWWMPNSSGNLKPIQPTNTLVGADSTDRTYRCLSITCTRTCTCTEACTARYLASAYGPHISTKILQKSIRLQAASAFWFCRYRCKAQAPPVST